MAGDIWNRIKNTTTADNPTYLNKHTAEVKH